MKSGKEFLQTAEKEGKLIPTNQRGDWDMEENAGIPVLINLTSRISYDGFSDQPIQMMTSGLVFPGKDFTLLRYQEVQQDQETGQVTESEIQLVLKEGQVTMNRFGDYANTMLFQRNKRFETSYRTPFGDMNMAVFTREARWEAQRGNGKIHLRYDLSMQGNYASTNELHLEYWTKDGTGN